MCRVDRHYRITKAAYEKVSHRNLEQFPTEKDFVTEAILSYEDQNQLSEILDLIKGLDQKLDRVIKAMGW